MVVAFVGSGVVGASVGVVEISLIVDVSGVGQPGQL